MLHWDSIRIHAFIRGVIGMIDRTWIPLPDTWPNHQQNAGNGEITIDVIRVDLDVDNKTLDDHHTLLSGEELDRLAKISSPKRKNEFIVMRGVLRTILSRILNLPSTFIQFSFGPHGKPFVEDSPVEFNMTHTRNLGLLAIRLNNKKSDSNSEKFRIGIDAELTTREKDLERLAKRYFASSEVEAWQSIRDEKARRLAFFHCWTRKEAFMKARGEGIALGLSSFEVSLKPDERPHIKFTQYNPNDANRWSVINLDIDTDHVAAIVVEQDPAHSESPIFINRWHWT